MDFSNYFEPTEAIDGEATTLARMIAPWTESSDLSEFDIALMAIPEGRFQDLGSDIGVEGFNSILTRLGKLEFHGPSMSIVNLGTFKLGATLEDTEAAVSEIMGELLQNDCIPIVLGAHRGLLYAAYKAFANDERIVNLTSVDKYLNIEKIHGSISRIIKEQPNFLFNYSNLCYQSYYVSASELKLADELYFDAYRLGEIRSNVRAAEPVLRGAELVSISLETIKSSDFKSAMHPEPNGLYAEETCQLSRYSGLSEKCKLFFLSDMARMDSGSDESLVAQLIWCFLDGFAFRKQEYPGTVKSEFLKYRVTIQGDSHEIVFYKSLNTDRWWMEVPVPPQYANKYRRHHIIPCDYEDYEQAANDDVPTRWIKTYKKML